jgi:mRNA-degrading endonuclease YafQ of YafQ-DinJ toxin-antitoxin module
MANSTIIPVSMPQAMAATVDARARRLAMTRSEYIRTLVRREVEGGDAENAALAEALNVAAKELKAGKTRVLKKGDLSAMLKK